MRLLDLFLHKSRVVIKVTPAFIVGRPMVLGWSSQFVQIVWLKVMRQPEPEDGAIMHFLTNSWRWPAAYVQAVKIFFSVCKTCVISVLRRKFSPKRYNLKYPDHTVKLESTLVPPVPSLDFRQLAGTPFGCPTFRPTTTTPPSSTSGLISAAQFAPFWCHEFCPLLSLKSLPKKEKGKRLFQVSNCVLHWGLNPQSLTSAFTKLA